MKSPPKHEKEIQAILRGKQMNRYFQRMKHVKINYLQTENEMRQHRQIESLFIKYDTDISRGLDAEELVELYQ